MSRETKIGLVVSCSFLCLVGAVVYTKLKQGAFRPGTEGEADAELVAKSGAPPEPAPAGAQTDGAGGQTQRIDQSGQASGDKSGSAPSASPTYAGPNQNEGDDGPAIMWGGGSVVPAAAATSQPLQLQ